jgi:hypothetical protein
MDLLQLDTNCRARETTYTLPPVDYIDRKAKLISTGGALALALALCRAALSWDWLALVDTRKLQ